MPKLMPVDEILALLEAHPQQINAAVDGRSATQLAERPSFDQWSITENLVHIYACAVVWGKRITDMIEQDEPTLHALHPMTWLKGTNHSAEDFATVFSRFKQQRSSLLATLSRLPDGGWNRSATFTGGGKPRVYTVHTEADAIARHERVHVKQIARLAKSSRNST